MPTQDTARSCPGLITDEPDEKSALYTRLKISESPAPPGVTQGMWMLSRLLAAASLHLQREGDGPEVENIWSHMKTMPADVRRILENKLGMTEDTAADDNTGRGVETMQACAAQFGPQGISAKFVTKGWPGLIAWIDATEMSTKRAAGWGIDAMFGMLPEDDPDGFTREPFCEYFMKR